MSFGFLLGKLKFFCFELILMVYLYLICKVIFVIFIRGIVFCLFVFLCILLFKIICIKFLGFWWLIIVIIFIFIKNDLFLFSIIRGILGYMVDNFNLIGVVIFMDLIM